MKRAVAAFAAFAALPALLALAGGPLHAQTGARSPTGPLVYPAKGQNAQQADRDRYECHDWARQQSGFDPSQAMPPPTGGAPAARAPAEAPAVPVALVRSAATGAAVAELADRDAGKGAAAGVLGGGLRQRVQAASAQAGAATQAQGLEQQAALAHKRSTYERGFAACLEARGYVVK